MRTERPFPGARLLAAMPMALLCVLASLNGLPAPRTVAGPIAEASRSTAPAGWGDHSAPAGSHQLERGRLRGNAVRPGYQSAAGLSESRAYGHPAGATALVEVLHPTFLPQGSEGAHLGRSPPHHS